MKTILMLGSVGILITLLGCSGNAHKTASKNAPTVGQTSGTSASTSPSIDLAEQLTAPTVVEKNGPAWHTEMVKDAMGGGVALKRTSLDGAYDLVILEKGSQDFLAFARHARWESAHDQPAKGTLMFLRVKFEDGMEKRVEWDELEFATENVHSVLWSYPAKNDSPLGPVADGSKNDSVGGDQLLLEDMMRHKTMLLETAPGTTTQFDLTGLAHEIAMMRSPKILKTEPVLAASQGDE